MTTTAPAFDVCVLIPCYNNTSGLLKSINSIVYPPNRLQVLIVDDGSNVAITPGYLQKNLLHGDRINILVQRLEKNSGILAALNNGLRYFDVNCSARYLARLDAGDICTAERFAAQVAYLDAHREIDLLGSWCYFKNSDASLAYEYKTPTQHSAIENSMYWRNVFIHPTVMWRVASLKNVRYPENYPDAEDYGLFYDIVNTRQSAILDAFLVTCEINASGISLTRRFRQLKSRMKVVLHFGKNKWKVFAAVCKLLLLMAVPKGVAMKIKQRLFAAKQ